MVVVVMVVVEYKGLGHLLAVQLLLPQPRVNTMNILSSVCLAVVNTISQSDITNILWSVYWHLGSEGNYQRMQILV